MTLTIDNATINRMKVPYIATACGLALAISAAIGFSGTLDRDTKAGGSSAAVVPVATSVEPAMPQLVFYLVSSQSERARLEALFAMDSIAAFEAGGTGSTANINFLVADTPEAEAQAMQIINIANGEATALGTFTVDFVDLRAPTGPID